MGEIKPALTAEEWADTTETASGGVLVPAISVGTFKNSMGGQTDRTWIKEDERHGIAARALHNQPFGFTREDVENHRGRAAHLHACGIYSADVLQLADWHTSMADRISALLPPEDDGPTWGDTTMPRGPHERDVSGINAQLYPEETHAEESSAD